MMILRRSLNMVVLNGANHHKNWLLIRKMSFEKSIIQFEERFEKVPDGSRDKKTFHLILELFRQKRTESRGHVEFINAALRNLKKFGLHKDLDTYKALLNIFPKGIMVPQNPFQRMFLHYPVQNYCCVQVLDQMEWFGVQPDKELHEIVVNAFGQWTISGKKAKRMLYWMPKLKNTNKYLDRRDVEGKDLSHVQLAHIALKMIARDPGTSLSYVKISGIDLNEGDQWLVSAQSPLQQLLTRELELESTVYVDGPKTVYLMDRKIEYVTMTADPRPDFFDNFRQETDNDFETWHTDWEAGHWPKRENNVNEQKNETILALAILGITNRIAASAWVNHLQETDWLSRNLRILFRIREGSSLIVSSGANAQYS